eukprot:360771-Chlamydomonas_euryale.AAC.3
MFDRPAKRLPRLPSLSFASCPPPPARALARAPRPLPPRKPPRPAASQNYRMPGGDAAAREARQTEVDSVELKVIPTPPRSLSLSPDARSTCWRGPGPGTVPRASRLVCLN